MKLLIVSDIHGNINTFQKFCDLHIKRFMDHKVIFLGDFYGYYYDSNEIVKICIDRKYKCILGNHDKYFLDVINEKTLLSDLIEKYGISYQLALNEATSEIVNFIKSLPLEIEINVGDLKILLCHGSPLDKLNGRIYPDTNLYKFKDQFKSYDIIITGHTHHKLARKIDNCLFLNPGSLGQQRDGAGCSFLSLDLLKRSYKFHEIKYNLLSLEQNIKNNDPLRSDMVEVLRRSRPINFGIYNQSYNF
ncbi:metallophosphatase family protein [Amylibacter sp.]|nr:metallophosphatase family protein [Amylibacter sp.]